MKNPKVGERCKFYSDEPDAATGFAGTIDKVKGQYIHVLYDNENDRGRWFHRTHLIRLKPKRKAREIWVNYYSDGATCPGIYADKTAAVMAAPVVNVTATRFREVLSD